MQDTCIGPCQSPWCRARPAGDLAYISCRRRSQLSYLTVILAGATDSGTCCMTSKEFQACMQPQAGQTKV